MPRRRALDPTVKRNLCIPGSVAAEVELLLFDPVRNKRRYGGLSELTTALYRQWIHEQRKAETDAGTD